MVKRLLSLCCAGRRWLGVGRPVNGRRARGGGWLCALQEQLLTCTSAAPSCSQQATKDELAMSGVPHLSKLRRKKNEEKEKAGQRVVDGRNWGGAAGLAWSWFPGCEREREGGREGNGRNTDSRKCPGRVQVGWWMMSLVGRAWVHRADLCRLGLCFAGLVGAWGLSLLSQSHSPQQSRHMPVT